MKLQGKNVLVTGGAGFIGSHLVDRIIQEAPGKLVVVDNFFLGQEMNLAEAKANYPEILIYRLDASNLASMRQLVEEQNIEVVFDLATVPLPTSLKFPAWTVETNVRIATTFCELTRWGLIQTLIHCSSSEAYGSADYVPMDESHPLHPTTPYAASKAAADQVVLSYRSTFGIDTAIVRPFNTFGPRQNPGSYAGIIPIIIRRVERGKPIEIFGDGEQTRDFNYVKDIAESFLKVYESEITRGKVINIATGKETSVNRLVSYFLEAMGKPNHEVVHKSPRPGDVRRHCGDISLVNSLIQIKPSGLSKDNIIETVEWYLSEETR